MGLNPKGWNKPSGIPAKQKCLFFFKKREKRILEVDENLRLQSILQYIRTVNLRRNALKKKADWWIAELVFFFLPVFQAFYSEVCHHFNASQRHYCTLLCIRGSLARRSNIFSNKMNDVCVLCVHVWRHFHTVWSRIEIPVLWKTQAWNAKITSSGSL